MISERLALLRQAQAYFHQLLLGVVRWDDVKVDKAIPIPSIRGNREQGKVRDLVIASFDGFRMEMFGPFEDEKFPMGCVIVSRGGQAVLGPLDAATWVRIADFIKEQKQQGADNGAENTASAPAGDDWGH